MNEWVTILSNFGVGGGLAFLFAWYLIKSLIPSLTRTNDEQRGAFLNALREERADFLLALRQHNDVQEKFTQKVTESMSILINEVRRLSELIASALLKKQTL